MFLNGPIPVSFCLFSSFSQHNFNNTNWKKCRWCAWDSSPQPQSGRHRQNHGTMAAALIYWFLHTYLPQFEYFHIFWLNISMWIVSTLMEERHWKPKPKRISWQNSIWITDYRFIYWFYYAPSVRIQTRGENIFSKTRNNDFLIHLSNKLDYSCTRNNN